MHLKNNNTLHKTLSAYLSMMIKAVQNTADDLSCLVSFKIRKMRSIYFL